MKSSKVAVVLHILGILGLVVAPLYGVAGCMEYDSFTGRDEGAVMLGQAARLALGSLVFIGLARIILLLERLVVNTSTKSSTPPLEDVAS